MTPRIYYSCHKPDRQLIRCFIENICFDSYPGACFACVGCGDINPPWRDMDRVKNFQPHMPVDTRSRIPATVLSFILYLDNNCILFTEFYFLRYIKPKTRVTVRMGPHMFAIEPDICIHVDAVKLDLDPFIFLLSADGKRLPIPARSSNCKPTTHLADGIWIKWAVRGGDILDTPVVWQV